MQRDEAGKVWIFNSDQPDGMEALMAENGEQPADCPDGAYFVDHDESTDQYKQVRGCNTEDAYDVAEMPSDMTTESGDPFPDNSYLLTLREN